VQPLSFNLVVGVAVHVTEIILIVAFPFDVAVGVSLGDAEDAVDAVGTGSLQR